MWFIPEHTYLTEFIKTKVNYYPKLGFDGMILMGKINYTEEYPKINALLLDLENNTDILEITLSWVRPFHKYMLRNYKKGN